MADDEKSAGLLTWPGALRIAVGRRSLRRTVTAALVVGTTLALVNLAGPIAADGLSLGVAVKLALTYLVPWGNATFGVAIGQRDRAEVDRAGARNVNGTARR